jgi:hypothetical protein
MSMIRKLTAFAIGAFSAWLVDPARVRISTPLAVHSVVLVHDAWVDGSSWSEMIPRFQAYGKPSRYAVSKLDETTSH